MIIISHRGNLYGPGNKANPYNENSPEAILLAIGYGFNVEIDVRVTVDVLGKYNKYTLWCGHDKPEYRLDPEFLKTYKDKLVIHVKDIPTAEFFSRTDFNWFYHENDSMVLTSWRWLWLHPSRYSIKGVNLQFQDPDLVGYINPDSFGICTDYPLKYRAPRL